MKIGNLVRFDDERFFDGAVQLRWVQERPERARQAATAFVFHGPRYHGAADARSDGIEGGYRLKDTASLTGELVESILAGLRGEERNPFCLAVAGYGAGKSHLATAIACLLGAPGDSAAAAILANIRQADAEIGEAVAAGLAALARPVLVLCLDGMAGFHLGNALSQAVFAQLERYGVDAGAIRELSPRFQTAEQFVRRNYAMRTDAFARALPGMDAEAICARLRINDEDLYARIDTLYTDANGLPIPVTGQESAQELIDTLCEVYCGPNGIFSGVLILFDELGRYLEYAAEKPQLAGDAALQQLFQGVQDNSAKVRFVGLIQYELKAYLKRFSSADLRQIQRYIGRFDTAEKLYLSTNLETIFAHTIAKDEAGLDAVWRETAAERAQQTSWQRISASLPGFERSPVWNDPERFGCVIARGCWPLHPLATWFLTRQRDVVQSRSAMALIKDVIRAISDEDAANGARLRQVSAADLVLRSMLPEMLAAEEHSGSVVAETLQSLLEKLRGHLSDAERLLLAGVAVLEKMGIGKRSQPVADDLLAEATALESDALRAAVARLTTELGALEWNADLGRYELIADASTRGQFQHWMRQRQAAISADMVRDLFVARAARDADIGNIETDFGRMHDIATPDWFFEARYACAHSLEAAVKAAFDEWQSSTQAKDAKGRVVYLYLHAADNPTDIDQRLGHVLKGVLERTGLPAAPVLIVGIADPTGAIADRLGRLHLFDEQLSADERERFRRFVPEERERSLIALKEAIQEAVKARLYWIPGIDDVPIGRLKAVAEHIFARVYPSAVPFPFDGFATAAGGGMADAAQLARSLIARQVDGPWVQAQPRRLQNRVTSLLADTWRALAPTGKLGEPVNPRVKAVFDWLKEAHTQDPSRTLLPSYRELMAPPFGMNAASAAVLLGLLIGGTHPPRRIEQGGNMVAAADWVGIVFSPQRGKYSLEAEILKATRLRFLSEDSEGRWRKLLEQWESEVEYRKIVALGAEAERMHKAEPMPEVLYGTYKYLRDKTEGAALKLREVASQLKDWEQGIERAERQNNVGELLKVSTLLFRQRQQAQDQACWPDSLAGDCDNLLSIVRGMVAERVADWIPRQGCHNAGEVTSFRQRMDKAIESLKKLGFSAEAKVLEQQAQRSIFQVEKRQQFHLTLSESDDYPRQPDPTASTTVRELRDAITKGDALAEGIKQARSVLSEEEIAARVKAVEERQHRLRAALAAQNKRLAELYSFRMDSEESLREAITRVSQLREIFVGSADEREVNDLAVQLQRVAVDIGAWESGEVAPERLAELLEVQVGGQLAELQADLSVREIDPAWTMADIYRTVATERVEAARRRSAEWVKPRIALADKIAMASATECERIERELLAPPGYLAASDLERVERLLETVRLRRTALEEQARAARIAAWQRQFPAPGALASIDKHRTEALLQALRNPPDTLLPAERAAVAPIEEAVVAHLDRMSLDEILERIRRLSEQRQRELFSMLMAQLA